MTQSPVTSYEELTRGLRDERRAAERMDKTQPLVILKKVGSMNSRVLMGRPRYNRNNLDPWKTSCKHIKTY